MAPSASATSSLRSLRNPTPVSLALPIFSLPVSKLSVWTLKKRKEPSSNAAITNLPLWCATSYVQTAPGTAKLSTWSLLFADHRRMVSSSDAVMNKE